MNNVNKLANVALALFLAAGVVSCGCGDDPEKKEGDKVKVKLTSSKTEFKKNFVPTVPTGGTPAAVALVDGDVKTTITVTVEEGEITEELAKTIKLSGAFSETDKKDQSLDKVNITKLEKGKSATFDVVWWGGKADLAALVAEVSSDDAEAQGTTNTGKQKARASVSKKLTFELSGVEVSTKAEVNVEFTPKS